jgi:hypothetical protein
MTTNSSIIFNIAERNSFLHNAMIYYSYPNSLGYRLGMCSILVCWVTWDCIWGYVKDGHSTIGGRTAFPVFRACGGLLLVHWFWGFSVYVWNRYRINYIFLFDFDPRIVDTPISIFEDATDETLVFLILMLLYYKVSLSEERGSDF